MAETHAQALLFYAELRRKMGDLPCETRRFSRFHQEIMGKSWED
jgi:hypothetical protein